MQISLLETGSRSAALNMGIDEAILEAVALGERGPTLRLYGWEPRAISVGYFQSLEEEVDLDACERRGVDVVRRSTGGGAVYHAAELTYSIVIPETHALVPASILDSYRVLCHGVIEGLGLLGLHASFAPINDIVLDGRKLSGNAQTRKRGCVLQHGTILLEVDVDAMFELLKVPQEKLRGKLISEVKERVSSVSRALGRSFGYAEALEPFSRGFAKALGVQLVPEPLSAALLARGEHIAREKFSQSAWTRKR